MGDRDEAHVARSAGFHSHLPEYLPNLFSAFGHSVRHGDWSAHIRGFGPTNDAEPKLLPAIVIFRQLLKERV